MHSHCRKLAILVAPNVHVAITAAVTYHMLENHGGPMTFLEAALLTYKVSVVRNLIITVGMKNLAIAFRIPQRLPLSSTLKAELFYHYHCWLKILVTCVLRNHRDPS
jgi:hypothetical protein